MSLRPHSMHVASVCGPRPRIRGRRRVRRDTGVRRPLRPRWTPRFAAIAMLPATYRIDREMSIDDDSFVYLVRIGTSVIRRPDVTASTSSCESNTKSSE